MKRIVIIERGELRDGSVVWRQCCTACGIVGAWLKNINDAERNAALHERAVHAEKVVA